MGVGGGRESQRACMEVVEWLGYHSNNLAVHFPGCIEALQCKQDTQCSLPHNETNAPHVRKYDTLSALLTYKPRQYLDHCNYAASK